METRILRHGSLFRTERRYNSAWWTPAWVSWRLASRVAAHETRTRVAHPAEFAGELSLGPTGRSGSRVSRRAIGIGLAIVLLWGLSFALDPVVSEWIAGISLPGTPLRRAMTLSAHFFRWPAYVLLGGLLLLHVRRWWLLGELCATLVATLVVLHALKYLIGRMRPDGGCGAYCFCPLGNPEVGFDSFPSGHATVTVLLVTVGLLYLPRLRVPLITLGALACLSRIALERHFVSDVVAGAGLALLMVYLARRWLGPAAFPQIRPRDLRVPRPRRAVLVPTGPVLRRASAVRVGPEPDTAPAIGRWSS